MNKVETPESQLLPQQKLADAVKDIDDLSAFASFLIDFAIASIQAEKGSLWLQDGRQQDLYIVCARGIPPEITSNCRTRLGEGIAGVVASGRRPVFVPCIEHDRTFGSWRSYGGHTPSFIACPVISRSRLLGLLTLSGRRDGRPFSEQDFAHARRIAEEAGIPLDNYHLAEQLRGCSAPTSPPGMEWLPRLSREWRNPLNSIYGAVYYLRSNRKLAEKERDDFLAIIARETRKLIDLTEKQLDLLQRGRTDAVATKAENTHLAGNDSRPSPSSN